LRDNIQLLVSGLQNGIAYGLVGLALVLIYKTSRALNFAQGTMAAFAGYAAYELIVVNGWPWLLGALGGMAIAAVLGLGVERLAIRPVLGAPLLSLVIATLAVDSMLANYTQLRFGTDVKPFPSVWEGDDFDVLGISVGRSYVVIALVTVAILGGLAYLLQRTRFGIAMRAFADDQFAAELMGIPPARVSRAVWVISAVIGGITGILFAPLLFLQLGYMAGVFIKGFTAAVVGGFTSLGGSVVGGLLLGVLEAYAIKYAPAEWAPMLPLLLILAVLLVRPNGLFSRGEVRRV
jgi:branched-chain amino acid transport system permease protein